jgi:hypothetical protein
MEKKDLPFFRLVLVLKGERAAKGEEATRSVGVGVSRDSLQARCSDLEIHFLAPAVKRASAPSGQVTMYDISGN